MTTERDTELLYEYVLNIIENIGSDFPQKYLAQLKEVIRFKLLLNEETDRGCALMAAAFIDYRLAELLKKYLIKDKIVKNLLEPSGPFGTFSSRINIAYSLALIPNAMQRDLHIVRKIRNEFAHTPQVVTFENSSISNRCHELKYSGNDRAKLTSRECFTRAILGIDGTIVVTILETKRLVPTLDEDFNSREQMFELLNNTN